MAYSSQPHRLRAGERQYGVARGGKGESDASDDERASVLATHRNRLTGLALINCITQCLFGERLTLWCHPSMLRVPPPFVTDGLPSSLWVAAKYLPQCKSINLVD